jgi:hypothetical protein
LDPPSSANPPTPTLSLSPSLSLVLFCSVCGLDPDTSHSLDLSFLCVASPTPIDLDATPAVALRARDNPATSVIPWSRSARPSFENRIPSFTSSCRYILHSVTPGSSPAPFHRKTETKACIEASMAVMLQQRNVGDQVQDFGSTFTSYDRCESLPPRTDRLVRAPRV